MMAIQKNIICVVKNIVAEKAQRFELAAEMLRALRAPVADPVAALYLSF